MKDEITALIILALLMGMFFVNSHGLNTKQANFNAVAKEPLKSRKLSHSELEEIKEVWNREKKTLYYTTAHGNILAVEECMEMAEAYMSLGREEYALMYVKRALHQLGKLKESEKISLDNIF